MKPLNILLTVLLFVLPLLAVIYKALPPSASDDEPDFNQFGKIPVVMGGRVQPIDSVARNSLLAITGRQRVVDKDDQGNTITLGPSEWIAEVIFDFDKAAARPVILVENDEVKALFGKQESDEKRFALLDITGTSEEISEFARAAGNKPRELRSPREQGTLELYSRSLTLGRLSRSIQPVGLTDYDRWLQELPNFMQKAYTETRKLEAGEPYDTTILGTVSAFLREFNSLKELHAFTPIPPLETHGSIYEWNDVGEIVLEKVARGNPDEAMSAWARIADGYRQIADDGGEAFNREVANYLAFVEALELEGAGRVNIESWFNHFQPFMVLLGMYLFIFLVVLSGWLTAYKPVIKIAFNLSLAILVLHTLALIMRIWISGRPPVTNLYSSAIFIGWGILVLALIIERLWLRNGLGTAVASVLGFATLLIAHHLSFDGDTLEVKVAVLDSNFWLATHVIVITLGYSACFLAGAIGLFWLVFRLSGTKMLKQRDYKIITSCVYGILCFAILFSFFGTVLGGIWADQSWGRFWGWDPKENGALMIVLWLAIILHGRWGGFLRERGIMCMAIGANIITAWSWFGTNLLGVGLHSYGFMEGAFVALYLFIASQLLAMGLVYFVPDPAKSNKSDRGNKRGNDPLPVSSEAVQSSS